MDGSCKEYPTPRHFSRQLSMPLLLVLWNNIFDAHLPLKCDIHNSNAMNDMKFLLTYRLARWVHLNQGPGQLAVLGL